jgi:hypothetical protein
VRCPHCELARRPRWPRSGRFSVRKPSTTRGRTWCACCTPAISPRESSTSSYLPHPLICPNSQCSLCSWNDQPG